MSNVAKVVEQTQQLAEIDAPSSMLSIIARAASDPNTDIDKLERLMAMKERMDAKVAETAFNDAMNRAQSMTHRVKADRTNNQTRSQYATYAALDRALRPIYTECGFSLSFDTGADAPADVVRVVCYVSHKSGHTRTYRVDMPADGKGAKGGDVMTKTHAAGSAMSYGSRYLLKLIFNVAIGEDDDDGNGASSEPDRQQLDWIATADSIVNLVEYKARKDEVCAAYGGATRVPKDVLSAFNRRFVALTESSK